MWLSLVRVALVRRIHHEVATGARQPYQFSRCLQPAAVAVVAYQVCKPEQTAAAAAARLLAVAVQRAEQEAKETTAVPSLTLYRRLLVQVVAALALLAIMAVQFVVLAALAHRI
jgi:hypothetical protein